MNKKISPVISLIELPMGETVGDVLEERDQLREALIYLAKRCEREYRVQDQPPELDLVMLAVAEVRQKTGI